MNTRGNSNQSTSAALNSQTAAPRSIARKSTATRKIIPVDNNTTSDSSSASNSPTASPGTARKSAGTCKTIPEDNNATPDSSSITGSQTASPGTARKSLRSASKPANPANGNTSPDSTSAALNSQTAAPRSIARKSTGTRKIIPVDNNTTSDSSASNSPTASPGTARRSTGPRKTVPEDNNATADSTSGTLNSQTVSPRKGRKSTGTRPIAPANSSTSMKRTTRSSNPISVQMPSQSPPSSSLDVSQPGCSWQGTQSSNNISVSKRSKKSRKNSQSSSDEELSLLNLDNLVSKCVKYFLVVDQKKYAIKKQDIIKNVFEHQDAKLYKTVIDKASKILQKTFGLEILNIDDRKNEYLLINIIDRELGTRDFAEYSPSELQKQGLIFYLLALIYMNENVILEDQLWKALEPLGIDINSRVPHAVFGDVKKYITVELVKQMYLEYRCISKDPVQHEIVWGQRAKQEVGKEDLLEFACKVMGDTRPQDWHYQYNDAMSKDSPEE